VLLRWRHQASEKEQMETYVIVRRNGWRTSADFRVAAERSSAAGEEMSDDVVWIRSYVLEERDGTIGTFCVYQASSPEAIRTHAAAAKLPVDEIVRVSGTEIDRLDPVPRRRSETR
jgi:hypothetical protein